MEVSGWTKDHFDHVITDSVVYRYPNSPDRFPDEYNDGNECLDPPITKRVRTDRVFIATQEIVSESSVGAYVRDLEKGAAFPPLAAIKCKDGIIVWNGHHRLAAHRLAGRKTILVRYWGEILDNVL